MRKVGSKKAAKIFYSLIILLSVCAVALGTAQLLTPGSVSILDTSIDAQGAVSTQNEVNSVVSYTETNKLFGVIPIKEVDVKVIPDVRLIPCGDVFGVKFFTKGVMVIGLSELESDKGIYSPAQKAGLKVKDIITHIDQKEVNSVEELSQIIEQSNGKPLLCNYTRDEQEFSCYIEPVKSIADNSYKSGLWVRDSTAGIGTMTYYNPKDGSFSGLGHGICDVDTGSLMPLLRGIVVDVELNDVIKGKEGKPGELKGNFGTMKKGVLLQNTQMGVHGFLDNPPENSNTKALPIATKDQVKEGKATIMSNVDGKGVKEYEIEITRIYHNNQDTKNFIINVTDKQLIEKTGGIVQGMSGSPILQNGRIVGAVTHVLVSNPTKGYGIFIENMLAEAVK